MCCPNWKLTPGCYVKLTQHDLSQLTDILPGEWVGRTTRMPWHTPFGANLRLQARQALEVALQEMSTFFVWTANWQTSTNRHELPSKEKRRYPYFGSGQFHSIFTSNFSQQSMWRTIIRSSSPHLKQRISVSVVPGWFVLMSGCFPIHTVVRLVHAGCLGRKRKHPQHHKLHRQPGRCKSKKIVTGILCNNIVLSVIWLVLQIRSSSGFICERMPNHWQEQLSLASWCVSLAEQCNRHRPFTAKKVPQRDPRRTCGGFPWGESERSDFPWCSLA